MPIAARSRSGAGRKGGFGDGASVAIAAPTTSCAAKLTPFPAWTGFEVDKLTPHPVRTGLEVGKLMPPPVRTGVEADKLTSLPVSTGLLGGKLTRHPVSAGFSVDKLTSLPVSTEFSVDKLAPHPVSSGFLVDKLAPHTAPTGFSVDKLTRYMVSARFSGGKLAPHLVRNVFFPVNSLKIRSQPASKPKNTRKIRSQPGRWRKNSSKIRSRSFGGRKTRLQPGCRVFLPRQVNSRPDAKAQHHDADVARGFGAGFKSWEDKHSYAHASRFDSSTYGRRLCLFLPQTAVHFDCEDSDILRRCSITHRQRIVLFGNGSGSVSKGDPWQWDVVTARHPWQPFGDRIFCDKKHASFARPQDDSMPSITHQALTTLIRDNPALGAYLFEVATGKSLPPDCELQLTSAQYTDLSPPEYSADAAYVIAGPATDVARNTAGGGSVIFEIQLTRDDTKPAAWHHYVATMHRQSRNLVTLIVIAVTESMARWCARPLAYDHVGINTFEPVVLGPEQIPRITDLIQAEQLPALAVLSVAAHGQRDDGAEIALAALGACKALDNDRGTQYADFVFGWLGEAARFALEKLMAQHGYEYQSDFAKGYFSQGLAKGREEGLEEGLEQGIEQGLEQGIEQGLEQGIEQGLEQGRESGLLSGIEAICKVLALELTPERRRLLAQSSVDELERLLETLTSQQRWPE